MSIETLPSDLREAVATITVHEQTAETVMAGLSPSQLNWQPRGGKAWSILQCLEHLNKAHNAYLKSMLPVLRAADPAKIPVGDWAERDGPVAATTSQASARECSCRYSRRP